jgi:hypothetical protein
VEVFLSLPPPLKGDEFLSQQTMSGDMARQMPEQVIKQTDPELSMAQITGQFGYAEQFR